MTYVNVYEVKNLRPFRTYDQLSESARPKAREGVLQSHRDSIRRKIEAVSKIDLNSRINDPYHIRRIHNSHEQLKQLSTAPTAMLEDHIVENLCHFLEDGTYVTYMLPVK